MSKKTPRQKLTEELDKIVKQIVKLRDDGLCQHCGGPVTKSNAHVSHVIPRSRGNALRWDLLNLILLCFHCHINWWHKSPIESGKWFKDTFPARDLYLTHNAHAVVKWSDDDLEQLYKKLKQKLKDVRAGQ